MHLPPPRFHTFRTIQVGPAIATPTARTNIAFGNRNPDQDKLFATPEEMKKSKTPQQKKWDHGIDKGVAFLDSKIDTAIVCFGFLSLLIPPLQLLAVPLNIIRFAYRFIQGYRTPVEKIDAYWDEIWAGREPNIHKL